MSISTDDLIRSALAAGLDDAAFCWRVLGTHARAVTSVVSWESPAGRGFRDRVDAHAVAAGEFAAGLEELAGQARETLGGGVW